MNKTDTTLIGVLAASDAVFRPMRKADWIPPTPAVLLEHRQGFAENGVPWSVGGGGTARLAGERELAALQEAGFLLLSGKAKRTGIKLTEAAEIAVRSLCGLPGLDKAHYFLREVIALSALADDGQMLCREFWLAEMDNYIGHAEADAEIMWELSLLLAPALSRGWVESNSDVHGRAWYQASDKGREVAKGPAPILPDELPEWSEPAGRFYHEKTIEARQQLRSQKPTSPSEIGFVPLPVSIHLQQPRNKKKTRR